MTRLVYMGNPEWAVIVLRSLHGAGHEIAAVYCAPDRPAGRGQKLTAVPVKELAQELKLPIRQPASLKGEGEAATLSELAPEFVIVVAYGLLLPKAILAIPKHGCLNLHFSLLPKWRGAAPVQRSVMAGETETGVTVMQMEAGLDTGPIVLQERVAIGTDETAAELGIRLSAIGGPLMDRAIRGIAAGELKPKSQPEGATHAAKLSKAEARLDWSLPAKQLHALICGLNPWPLAEITIHGKRLQILKAEIAHVAPALAPGEVTVRGGNLFVGAGDEMALELLDIKPEGKRAMAGREYARGLAVFAGSNRPV